MSHWVRRPVLVTGATGLVGSAVVRRLLQLEAAVTVLVRDWVPESELVGSGTIDRTRVVRGDITDAATMERVLAEYEIDTVLHLAAQTIVGVAHSAPAATFDTNVRGTWTVLEACRHVGSVSSIVVASSDKAYGAQENLPYTEAAPLLGRSPYDASKACGDIIAQSYAHTYTMPVAITRCGNFFGEGDLNWSRLIPGTIRALQLGERPVIRSDGTYVRDYFYTADGAAAYLLLAEELSKRPELGGEAFNFSLEQPLTVLEVVDLVRRVMGSDLQPDVRATAHHEIEAQVLSAAKAREVIGWQPAFGMEKGMAATVAWYRELLGSAA